MTQMIYHNFEPNDNSRLKTILISRVSTGLVLKLCKYKKDIFGSVEQWLKDGGDITLIYVKTSEINQLKKELVTNNKYFYTVKSNSYYAIAVEPGD